MRIFVASWFFPPATSSEGLVSFKLLSHSAHQFDVCSSVSSKWGYEEQSKLESPNITSLPVETEEFSEWIEKAVRLFEERHAKQPYDAFMTRSMPPESVEVGMKIKAAHPELPWFASFGDPLARTPLAYREVKKTKSLNTEQKRQIIQRFESFKDCNDWIGVGDEFIDQYCRYKNYEIEAIRNSDLLICPNGPQAQLMLCGAQGVNLAIIPHSYDAELYPEPKRTNHDKVELVFLGFVAGKRTLAPLIKALNKLRANNPNVLKNLKVRLIGNISDDSRSLIYNFYLNEYVSIEPSVDYFESLKIMREADWLVHVDAYYEQYAQTGGSAFLAGKLADYMGSGKPILALTGNHSPACRAMKQYGGIVVSQDDIDTLADIVEEIAVGSLKPQINVDIAQMYSSDAVAKLLDEAMDTTVTRLASTPEHVEPHEEPEESFEGKLISICVPAYNVELFIARCLNSLVECKRADALEVIVVNDGSHDSTADIAASYTQRYPKMIRLVNKQNGGHGSTINTAIQHAHGRYFRVLDGDDWLDPVELERLIDQLEALDESVDLISTNYCQINIETGKITRIGKKSADIKFDVVYNLKDIDVTKEYFSLGSTTYRLGLLKECNLKLFEHCFYVDVQYQMIPLPFVKTVMFTKGNLYHYAVGRDEQSVSRVSFVNRYQNHDDVMHNVLSYYMEHKDAMCESARVYYETLVLNNFVKTQFVVTLMFDDDRARGFARAKDFDEFLKDLNPEWYEAIGKKYPILKELRKNGFDPKKTRTIANLEDPQIAIPKRVVRKVTRKLMRGGVGDVVQAEMNKRAAKKK